jgi:cell wall-associated NlpC family hydrolase/SH3-like domain-containing protein
MRWWISAIFAGTMAFSLLGPLQTAAQQAESPAQAGQSAVVLVDTGLYAEPTTESPLVEWIGAGGAVTLLDSPIPSMFDGQLWIQAGTSLSVGFLLVSVVTTDPADPAVEPEPVIIAWKLVQPATEVPCLAEPRNDATIIVMLQPGQEIGLTADAVDGWQPVRCAEQHGYVQTLAFDPPAPVEEPELGDAPVSETPVSDEPSSDESPTEIAEAPLPEATETTVTEPEDTPEATPEMSAPSVAESPSAETTDAAAEAMILAPDPVATEAGEVSAIIGGGTGYVVGTAGAGVRCRAGANMDAATITVLSEGAAVTSRGAASGSWQPVYCAGQNGWIWADYVGNSPGSSGSTGATGTVRNTDGSSLRCRSSASFDGAVITTLASGASATIRGSVQSGWVPIICGGQNGWVHSDYFGSGASGAGSISGGYSSGQTVHVSGTDGAGVRFRSSASYTGAVISVLVEGSGLTVRTGSVGEWIAVTRNGSNGFIHRDYLATGAGSSSSGSVGSSDLTAGSHARVTESLRLRSGATLNAGTTAVAPAGTVVKITGAKSNGFYPVSWGNTTGYMHSDYLTWTSAALSPGSTTAPGTTTPVGNAGAGGGTATGQAIVNYALRYIGYPYVWAGRGPAQFDCAGFVYWVMFNTTGINLVGGVINQYTYGRPVAWGDLQPGDIVNFANTYTTGLSHNGIYIGNNQFVHASNETDGVIISNLTGSYYLTRWYGARRII